MFGARFFLTRSHAQVEIHHPFAECRQSGLLSW